MPKPGRGRWVKTKVSRCDGRLLLWFDGDPKEWDGKIPNFKAGENVRVLSCERRTDRTRVSWPRQKSHRPFLLAQTSFLCQQLLTNWVTHKIVLVLFRPLLYSKRPHGTSIRSGEAQQADPSTSRALSWLLSMKWCGWWQPDRYGNDGCHDRHRQQHCDRLRRGRWRESSVAVNVAPANMTINLVMTTMLQWQGRWQRRWRWL